ncbi:family 16 glycoside hydrolase [Maribacter litopenaei]|uniref:family 16 glycoside hydrolase n=1 Tax=Maribacter litopenaei TaxID=2976127 RepID=UPI003B84AF6A
MTKPDIVQLNNLRMKATRYSILLTICFCFWNGLSAQDDSWISLFNGENFDGWKVGKNSDSFSIEDNTIKVQGPVGHLFYSGTLRTTILRILSSWQKSKQCQGQIHVFTYTPPIRMKDGQLMVMKFK